MKNIHSSGFTLLELSIVLLIIGVLTAGIIIGKSLVVSSRLQTIVTDVDSYTAAVTNFKQTYQGLPGDFADATTRWGTDSNGCPTGGGTTGTCNGNGDGMLVNTNAASQANETFLFWQHLFKAGMFAKSLSNQASSTGVYASVIDINVPSASIKGSGFSVIWLGTLSGDPDRFDGFYGNVFQLGEALSGDITRGPILTADQAGSIDAKIDDGIPASGKVRAYKNNSTINPYCTTSANPAIAVYLVNTSNTYVVNANNTAAYCSLIFIPGF